MLNGCDEDLVSRKEPCDIFLPNLLPLLLYEISILMHFSVNFLFSCQQVSNEEPEKATPPANPPVVELGAGNQGTADDPEAEIPANPSREFIKFVNQARQLNVSFRGSSHLSVER